MARSLRAIGLLAFSVLLGCSNVLGYDDIEFSDDAGLGGSDTGGSGAGVGVGGGAATGGAASGGISAGGASTGGVSSGSGGASSGGASSGGASTGGVSSGSGGTSSGGASSGGASSGGTSSGGTSSGGTSSGGASSGGTGGGTTTDPFEAARIKCVDTINQLRATKGLPPYQRWKDGEACADLQATDDNKTGKAHGAWSSKKFGCDGGFGQNECLGGGASGIASCLNSMWSEKDKPGCAGCDSCTSSGGCAGCDFYGDKTGDVCGHYVNMSAKWFTKVACGFSSAGSWAVQNYR
ncbi:MAG: CAP domain-containing protein [Polyangiaceae bacterium]